MPRTDNFFLCVLCAFVVSLFPANASISSGSLFVETSSHVLISDPRIPTVIQVFRRAGNGKIAESNFSASVTKTDLVQLIKREHILYLSSRALENKGTVQVHIQAGHDVVTQTFTFRLPENDSDRDGFPDVVELGNDASFRDWFCAIAESQFYYPSDTWYDLYQNCSGLVEFAFNEALKKHDEQWAAPYPFLSNFSIADKRPYYYPATPFLGKRLFRLNNGKFSPETIEQDFAAVVNGNTLRNHSMVFISKQIEDALKGDLLCYFHPENLHMPAHIMIYTGSSASFDPLEGFVIYHTGPDDETTGFIKKVRISDLQRHPDPGWRPVPQNPKFLGVYRWKILD